MASVTCGLDGEHRDPGGDGVREGAATELEMAADLVEHHHGTASLAAKQINVHAAALRATR